MASLTISDTMRGSGARARSQKNAYVFAIVALLLLAIVLRCVDLGRFEISQDEAHSVLTATSSEGIFHELHSDTNPPLYFLLLKNWIALFGISPIAIRSFSVLCSVAFVAALAALVYQCGASRRTLLWTVLLATLAPLQIYYAQEARSYELDALLVVLSLLTFLRAVQNPGLGAWTLHALFVAAGMYAHNLMIPVTAAYWLAAVLMRFRWRQFLAMAAAHAAALVLALPAIILALRQESTSGGMQWIEKFWRATPPILAVPKSLEALGLGGAMPSYICTAPLTAPLQWFSIALMLAAGVALLVLPTRANSESPDDIRRPCIWLLLTFTIWPLLFIFVYSLVRKPIYLVARYDLIAQPAYLALLALGFSRLQQWLRGRAVWAGSAVVACVAMVLIAGIVGYWFTPVTPAMLRYPDRVAYVHANGAGAPIICTGLETSPTLYYLKLSGQNSPVLVFPPATLSHIGWFMSDQDIVAQRNNLIAQAAAIVHQAALMNPHRLWIFLDPVAPLTPGSPRQQLLALLLQTAADAGWHPVETDPLRRQQEQDLMLISLTRDNP